MKRLTIPALLLFLGSCQSSNDPNLQWLLSVTSGTVAPTTSPQTTPFTVNVGDVTGSTNFIFQSTTTIGVGITIVDPIAPVNGSLIQILQYGTTNQVLFSATTGSNGNVTGSFTIPNAAQPIVTVQFTYQGKTYSFNVDITSVTMINRYIFINASITDPPPALTDSDGDGIPDILDAYPNDATRAFTVSLPAGYPYYTIAFEDLYPGQGDADFNDYVARVHSEEDLNAKGEIVRVRSSFTHMAKGAKFNHILRMELPAGGQYTLKRTASDGTVVLDTTGTLVANTGIDILPRSDTTISQSNTDPAQPFKPGMSADFEVIFTNPVSTSDLSFPFDMYLYVLNTHKEIHFAGKVLNAQGTDPYLAQDGFPWELMIPGDWKWPLECHHIGWAYPEFKPWYASKGANDKDWYNTADQQYIFQR